MKNGTIVTLTFNPETGNMHGKAQCNSYHATFRLTPDDNCFRLVINNLGCTDISCPDAGMNAEIRYLALLTKVDAMTVTEYTLTLLSKGKEILKYELQ